MIFCRGTLGTNRRGTRARRRGRAPGACRPSRARTRSPCASALGCAARAAGQVPGALLGADAATLPQAGGHGHRTDAGCPISRVQKLQWLGTPYSTERPILSDLGS